MAVGDSKTYGDAWVNALGVLTAYRVAPATIAYPGWGIANVLSVIDSALIDAKETPKFVCINIGVNDLLVSPPVWVSNYQSVLDKIHAKWPGTQVYCMRVWMRGDAGVQALINTMDDTSIPAILSGRSWAHAGPDERVWLKSTDDGATYTTDGTHYSAAGVTEAANQWKTVLGL